ncbi:hypothetical protein [Pontibacter mangrovi]|uniref:Uncharacterized protein n=1 Tax=Pontibacter mangrovi TaxID=2589816 RepID=A0A501WEA4_9BACT|nr:hypothetical protein [Pontibacter mangrovi]TPE46414.1 hypothetical protein FJM65_03475 [Pontibacter mangrovi]
MQKHNAGKIAINRAFLLHWKLRADSESLRIPHDAYTRPLVVNPMRKVCILITVLLLSGCGWIQSKLNERIFDSEEYKQEEALAYVHLLEQISEPSRYYKDDKPRRFLFFVRKDSLDGFEKTNDGEGYLYGKLKARKLDLHEINKNENLKVLVGPDTSATNKNNEQEDLYWKYRKDFTPTIDVSSLSRIAFNKSYTKGVLSYWYSCGSLCGEGCILYIKKVKGRWVIDKKEWCIRA